jgi:hypothetical protein
MSYIQSQVCEWMLSRRKLCEQKWPQLHSQQRIFSFCSAMQEVPSGLDLDRSSFRELKGIHLRLWDCGVNAMRHLGKVIKACSFPIAFAIVAL